jgi:hypothetical protein
MTDTQRTQSELLTIFEDNNVRHITPQDMRDFVVSILDPVGDITSRNFLIWNILNRTYQHTVTVAPGSGTISTAIAAISDATATNRYCIYCPNGTYTDYIVTKSYVDILGQSTTGTILQYSAADGNYDTFSFNGTDTLVANLTINHTNNTDAGNVKYAIHIDTSSGGTSVYQIIYNCLVQNLGTYPKHAIGFGIWAGEKLFFINSTFLSPTGGCGIFGHNNPNQSELDCGLWIINCTSTVSGGNGDGLYISNTDPNHKPCKIFLLGSTFTGHGTGVDFREDNIVSLPTYNGNNEIRIYISSDTVYSTTSIVDSTCIFPIPKFTHIPGYITTPYFNQSDGVGIGVNATAQLHLGGAKAKNAWGLSGLQYRQDAAILTDLSSSGTVTNVVANGIATPTLAAISSTTYTNAASVYLAGCPIASTNVTITNPYTLLIGQGKSRFDGSLIVKDDTDGYVSQYPPDNTGTYVVATSNLNASYLPQFTCDPAKSLTGSFSGNQWLASATTNQRFHIDLGSSKIIKRIYYENTHSGGASTTNGAKTFTFYGSDVPTAFANTTYSTDTDWTLLTAVDSITGLAQFTQHAGYSGSGISGYSGYSGSGISGYSGYSGSGISGYSGYSGSGISGYSAADTADPQYITVTNTTPYRYYAIKIEDDWTGSTFMGLRRIELQTLVVGGSPVLSFDSAERKLYATNGTTTNIDYSGIAPKIGTIDHTSTTGASEGMIGFDASDHHFYGFNGTSWAQLDN